MSWLKNLGIAIRGAAAATAAGEAADARAHPSVAQRDRLARLGFPANLPDDLPGPWFEEFRLATMYAGKGLGQDETHLLDRWLKRCQEIGDIEREYIYRARLLRFKPDGKPDPDAMAKVIVQHARMQENEWLQWKRSSVMDVRI